MVGSPGPRAIFLRLVRFAANLLDGEWSRPIRDVWERAHGVAPSSRIAHMFQSDRQVDDYAEAERREMNPPIEVESATWSPGGTLD